MGPSCLCISYCFPYIIAFLKKVKNLKWDDGGEIWGERDVSSRVEFSECLCNVKPTSGATAAADDEHTPPIVTVLAGYLWGAGSQYFECSAVVGRGP
jgi:hypothetical protein